MDGHVSWPTPTHTSGNTRPLSHLDFPCERAPLPREFPAFSGVIRLKLNLYSKEYMYHTITPRRCYCVIYKALCGTQLPVNKPENINKRKSSSTGSSWSLKNVLDPPAWISIAFNHPPSSCPIQWEFPESGTLGKCGSFLEFFHWGDITGIC